MKEMDELKTLIEIPDELNLVIKNGIERGRSEKNKIVKLRKNNIIKKLGIAVASITILTTTVYIEKPELVQAIPVIRSIFKDFKYDVKGNKLKDFEEFSTSIDNTIEKSGIKITIKDIAIDENIVAITMIIQGQNVDDFMNKSIMGTPSLNGNCVSTNSEQHKRINDNTMETIIYGNISEMTLSENVDVDMNIIYVGNVKGPWEFKFRTNKNSTSKYSKTIDIDNKISLPTGKIASEFEIEKLVMSPFGNTLNYSGTYYEENKDMAHSGISGIDSFRVTDEKGKVLNIDMIGEDGDKNGYSGKIEILSDLSKTQSITVTPILKETGENEEVFNGKEYPIIKDTVIEDKYRIQIPLK